MKTLFFLLLLAGCNTTPILLCQSVKPWSDQEQKKMADDVNFLPPDSPLIGAMLDYARMRNEARECQEHSGSL